MPFWTQLGKRPRARGLGANVTLASAATPQERRETIAARLTDLEGYVIFANHDSVDQYVQFARAKDGSLLMEVASGAYATEPGRKLVDDELAVTTLGSLGLHAAAGENFSADEVTAAPATIAVWVEGIFLNLFRADDDYTMDVLGDPSAATPPSS